VNLLHVLACPRELDWKSLLLAQGLHPLIDMGCTRIAKHSEILPSHSAAGLHDPNMEAYSAPGQYIARTCCSPFASPPRINEPSGEENEIP